MLSHCKIDQITCHTDIMKHYLHTYHRSYSGGTGMSMKMRQSLNEVIMFPLICHITNEFLKDQLKSAPGVMCDVCLLCALTDRVLKSVKLHTVFLLLPCRSHAVRFQPADTEHRTSKDVRGKKHH